MSVPPPLVSRDCFDVFDHDADIGIVGRGATLEEAFAAGASAMFDLQCRIEGVTPLHRVDLEFDEADLEFAFVAWLNGLLSLAHTQGLALGRFALTQVRDRWRGAGWGERWHAGLARGIDVKGATLTMLSVREADGGWEARCVVDV